MDESKMSGVLCYVLANSDVAQLDDVKIETFEDAGLLTNNTGLVLSFPDGTTFQLTIVQSAGNQ